MQTVTLFGVEAYQPHSMILALEAWARSRQARCHARMSGNRLCVTIEAESPIAEALSEDIVDFYRHWRRDVRGVA